MKPGAIFLIIDVLLLAGILSLALLKNADARGIAGILLCLALLAGFYFMPNVNGGKEDIEI
jgi:hypothetical protein